MGMYHADSLNSFMPSMSTTENYNFDTFKQEFEGGK